MADDIRIKDLQSTASYMESDDYLPIDSLALGDRKITFAGIMDSEDDRLPTTAKSIRGALGEHEDDISEIKSSLSDLTEVVRDYRTTPVGYNGGGRIFIQKIGSICIIRFVDYVPKSPTGLQALTDLPFNMKTDNSNIIFNNVSSQFKILLSGNKIYSYYNADMSTNTTVFNGQVMGFVAI